MLKEIKIKNKHNETMSCLLNKKGSDSLIYLIPGEGEHKNQIPYQKISSQLQIDSLRCDLSAMGKSQGKSSKNNIQKRVNDFLEIHKKFKKQYKHFYFFGFSFGALTGLIASTKIKFEKQFLFSTALLAENREAPKLFLKAWGKLNTLPDIKAFEKGIIKPAKQKLTYDFVKTLKKYRSKEICKKIKSETFLYAGEREKYFIKQNNQIFSQLRTKKHKGTIKKATHNISQKQYINFILKLLKKEVSPKH